MSLYGAKTSTSGGATHATSTLGSPYVGTLVAFVRSDVTAGKSIWHLDLNSDSPLLGYNSGGVLELTANGGAPTSTGKMTSWLWYFLWMRFDAAGAVQAGFFPIGGPFSRASQRVATTWSTSNPSWGTLEVGGDQYGGGAHTGRISHFRLFKRWLTDDEIVLESTSATPVTGGARLWAPFTVGTTLRDRVITGTNWSLSNSPSFEADDPRLAFDTTVPTKAPPPVVIYLPGYYM